MQPSRNISAASDWQCVYDFAGYWSGFGFRDQTSLSVDWSPSLGVARFSGQWGETPDMPASSEPSEDSLERWAYSQETHFARRYRAARQREAAHKARMTSLEQWYAKGGGAKASVIVRKPDGGLVEQSAAVGTRSALDVARNVCAAMIRTYGPGARLVRFRYTPSPLPLKS